MSKKEIRVSIQTNSMNTSAQIARGQISSAIAMSRKNPHAAYDMLAIAIKELISMQHELSDSPAKG